MKNGIQMKGNYMKKRILIFVLIVEMMVIQIISASCVLSPKPALENKLNLTDVIEIDTEQNGDRNEKALNEEFKLKQNKIVLHMKYDFNLEENLFSEVTLVQKPNSIFVSSHEDDIYYIDNSDIYKINSEMNTPEKYFDSNEMIDLLEDEYGVYDLDGFLFLDDTPYGFVESNGDIDGIYYNIVNLDTFEVVEGFKGTPYGHFDGIVCYNDEYLEEWDWFYKNLKYKFFDILSNAKSEITNTKLNSNKNQIGLEKFWYSDNYFFIIIAKESPNKDFSIREMSVIDYKSKDILGTVKLDEKINKFCELFLCKDSFMYFFDSYNSCIKEYDYNSGTITTVVSFENECIFVSYDPNENCIYFLENYNFNHLSNGNFYSYHSELDNCAVNIDQAQQRLIKLNLSNFDPEVITSISLNAYCKADELFPCINYTERHLLGTFLFTYYETQGISTLDYSSFLLYSELR